MTLEVLFAQAHQGRTFLLMLLCGAAMGGLIQLSGLMYRVKPLLGMAADMLCAAGLALALGWILMGSGEGLRLYGLLGLCIGGALYAAGVAGPIRYLTRRRRKKG